MMLCMVKRMNDSDRALRAGTLKNRGDYMGREAYGKTIGIVGLGNVGSAIAELAGVLFKMKCWLTILICLPKRSKRAARKRSNSTICSGAQTSSRSTVR